MTLPNDAPVVRTAAGPVRGLWREAAPGRSAAFLGIPFAQAPVGPLRFAAPVPPEPWPEVRDAVAFGATAQRGDPGITLIPEPSVPGEATLNVNVFTPDPSAAARLPVMVWIHGGGFTAGSPASPWYDGRAFNRDGVVTVTISYRLGFDGFGWIAGAPGNRGVRDWIAALEWVQQNIGAFGGDPGRVTIAGQSAGGGAVLTLLGMPGAQHLFHAVYAVSPAIADVDRTRGEALASRIAAELGATSDVAGFTSASEEALLAAQKKATDPGSIRDLAAMLTDGLALGPAIDGELLVQPTLESYRQGVGADKPLVLGTADDEFAMTVAGQEKTLRWVPLALALGRLGLTSRRRSTYLRANRDVVARGHAAVVGRYATDALFRTGLVRAARARGHAPTWVYRIAFRSTVFGAAVHCVDVPFFFDCLDGPAVEPLTGPNPPQALADAVHGAALALITAGEPGWPAWSDEPGTAEVFGGPDAVRRTEHGAYAEVEPLL